MRSGDELRAEARMEAVGAGRPQNWPRALALLGRAADAGNPQAQAELEVLGLTPDHARSAADIDALFAFPQPERLSEQPRLRFVRGFASAAECAWLRGRGTLAPSQVFDPSTGGPRLDPRRSNRSAELTFDELDLVTQVLRSRISAATRLPLPLFEPPQVMRYEPGEEFQPHYDYLDPALAAHAGQRIATFLLYLNDDYEGGETAFPEAGQVVRGATGDALFFANVDGANRPDPLTLHAGRPPNRGTKWVFSQWIRDRSPAAARQSPD
ncbi:2OG-Fe(II) oxygenase [Sphingomonas kaistensis]|uniref:2OG-Fe(II) oxygenase n=1 Tax=Sphingomonas kaistensis TaxID=298708 RepID=A0ABZ2FX79_9SPHN